ncbi:MAG: indolepyruvate oxidoreductase subunit beta [Thermoanaerobaculales bacterium]|jgi:indolepyruvate ferredoxin oxidoreductase beta subunit|nr:indolepyruvate oxidoreductase subunit beta [Thermoanaerobaculales bacterium]
MDKNIILAGVGGQGILSIAFVIDNAALASGFEFKQAEVHGMAQRGGAVQSHLRYADHEIHSDLIPKGAADLVLSVEPLEVMRYWHYLRPDGWIVSSVTPYVNIPDYPEPERVLAQLATFPSCILVDGAQIAKAAGNLRAQNMVAVGAASLRLDFPEELLLTYVAALFERKGPAIVEVNQQAFRLGRIAGRFFRGLVEAGVPVPTAVELGRRLAPETLDPALAADWARVVADPELAAPILQSEEIRACDQVPVGA